MFAQYVAESLEDEPAFPFAIRTPQISLLALNLRETYVEGLNDLLLSFSDRTGLQVALVALRSDTTSPIFGPLTESEDLHFLDMIRPMPTGYKNAVVAGSDSTICPLLEAPAPGYRTLLDEERLDTIPPELVVAAGSAVFLLDVDVSIYVLSPGLYLCATRSEDRPPSVRQLQPDTRFHERVADVMDDFYFLPDPENIIGECQSLYYPLNCKTLVSLLNEETNVPDFRSCDGPQVLALCDWKCPVELEIVNSLPCPPETSNCLLGVKIGSLKDCSLPVWALELDFLRGLAAESEGQSYEFVTELGPHVWTSEDVDTAMDVFLSDEKQKNLNRIQCAQENYAGTAHAVGVAELLRREQDQRAARASTFLERLWLQIARRSRVSEAVQVVRALLKELHRDIENSSANLWSPDTEEDMQLGALLQHRDRLVHHRRLVDVGLSELQEAPIEWSRGLKRALTDDVYCIELALDLGIKTLTSLHLNYLSEVDTASRVTIEDCLAELDPLEKLSRLHVMANLFYLLQPYRLGWALLRGVVRKCLSLLRTDGVDAVRSTLFVCGLHAESQKALLTRLARPQMASVLVSSHGRPQHACIWKLCESGEVKVADGVYRQSKLTFFT